MRKRFSPKLVRLLPVNAITVSSTSAAKASPSFVIPGAGRVNSSQLQLDRINSGELLRAARQVYFRFLEQSAASAEPLGVILPGADGCGSVVFEEPVLLPNERFVPLTWLKSGAARPARRT